MFVQSGAIASAEERPFQTDQVITVTAAHAAHDLFQMLLLPLGSRGVG